MPPRSIGCGQADVGRGRPAPRSASSRAERLARDGRSPSVARRDTPARRVGRRRADRTDRPSRGGPGRRRASRHASRRRTADPPHRTRRPVERGHLAVSRKRDIACSLAANSSTTVDQAASPPAPGRRSSPIVSAVSAMGEPMARPSKGDAAPADAVAIIRRRAPGASRGVLAGRGRPRSSLTWTLGQATSCPAGSRADSGQRRRPAPRSALECRLPCRPARRRRASYRVASAVIAAARPLRLAPRARSCSRPRVSAASWIGSRWVRSRGRPTTGAPSRRPADTRRRRPRRRPGRPGGRAAAGQSSSSPCSCSCVVFVSAAAGRRSRARPPPPASPPLVVAAATCAARAFLALAIDASILASFALASASCCSRSPACVASRSMRSCA